MLVDVVASNWKFRDTMETFYQENFVINFSYAPTTLHAACLHIFKLVITARLNILIYFECRRLLLIF